MEQSELTNAIKAKVELYHKDTVTQYQHLHQHPELSFEEKSTSEYIEKRLNGWGIEYRSHIGGFGILACIKGQNTT